MLQASTNTKDDAPVTHWHGFHHIGLVTADLDATIRFYEELLGMEIGDIHTSPNGNHCFIRPGDTASWGLHFFEVGDRALPDPATLQTFSRDPAPHFAFAIDNEAAAIALQEHLQRHGIATTPMNTIGAIKNFLFWDINGYLLEATWAQEQEK